MEEVTPSISAISLTFIPSTYRAWRLRNCAGDRQAIASCSTVRQEYCQKQEKAHKPSVRAKLQATPKATSPKHSAKLNGQER